MSLPENFRQWTAEQTSQYLEKEGLEKWKDTFKDKNITGKMLPDLTVVTLKVMGITDPGDREKILFSIGKLCETPQKVFNDPIHGHMELHPLLGRIINTPQFQRLRNIKQLGGAYYVYPAASHNRFEHSIGVAHLAGELVKALRTRQPELDIDERDILCVQIAGLCHDLGHGPFSHLFDGMFIPEARPEKVKVEGKKWKHETASCKMFDHLVERNNLKPLMEQYGLVLSEDLIFIKEMIKPEEVTKPWPYDGRPEEKSFLYEIVSNKRNGVDVDKFDYFARDCYQLGLQTNFDHLRFFKFARVCEVDGQRQICVRDKEENNMSEMFHTRYCLHRRAYKHKVTNIIERMIADAFLKADKIEDSEGKRFIISEAIDDMEAYTKLTDNVFEQILNSTSSSKEMVEARQILERVTSRDLYKFLGETRAETTMDHLFHSWKMELAKALPARKAGNGQLNPEDFVIMVITMDYGMEDKDPIEEINFYSKHDHAEAKKRKTHERTKIRPMCFSEKLIRFYCKKTDDESFKVDKENFDQWCRRKHFPEYS